MSLLETRERFRSGGMDKYAYVEAMHAFHRGLLDYAEFIRSTDVAGIEVREGGVVLTCRSGLKLAYEDPLDPFLTPLTVFNFGAYEPSDTNMLLHLARGLDPAFTLLDIGANMGWYALNLALRFPACAVHAFEPVPATFRGLERNLELNGFPNVTLHRMGFLDQEGTQTFYADPRIKGRSSIRNLAEDPAALPVECPVRRMDDFLRERGIAPDALKVDVEGAELAVFQGGLETIRTRRPLVFTEMLRKWAAKFGYHPQAIMDLFRDAGYQCFFYEKGVLVELEAMTDSVEATNFFFLHRERHAGLSRVL